MPFLSRPACATRIARAFAAAALFTAPVTTGAQMASRAGKSPLEATVDPSIAPGDDFFAYANGAWLKTAVIPPGKERWTGRDEINAATRARIATLLDQARSAPAGSRARKVADFRAAWLDEATIEARGLAPLAPMLDSIDAVTDKVALARLLGRWMRADVDPLNWGIFQSSSLLGVSVERSIHGEKTYSVFLLQGGLGLPSADDYLGAEPRLLSARASYQGYLGSLLSFADAARAGRRGASAEPAERRAEAVFALETAIARTHMSMAASGADHNADNVWTRAELASRAPGLAWPEFLAAAGLGKVQSVVAWQPSAVTGAAALVASQPLETWKDYLRAHVVAAYADVLPRAVRDRAQQFRDALAAHPVPPAPREQRAVEATQAAMGDALGRMYAERYFPAEQKARVRRIIANVTAAFVKRLESSTWLSPESRRIAIAKTRALYVGIGYPERWPDDGALVIDAQDALGNVRRVADQNHRLALARLGRPVDMGEWWAAPHVVGAVLMFQQNAYDFAAALLQPPKFDPAASDAATYGAIGAIIGHDVVHFVDVLGAEYGVDGSSRHWWTAADSTRYQALAAPLVAQFAGYRPFPDAAVDGQASITENIADLAGLSAAFDAHRAALGRRAQDPAYVRQRDREFFIAFAQSWRSSTTDAGLRAQLTSDHAPERYRIATARNLDAWYDAFDVRPGQRLWLEPAARVRIW